jgi:hypothetical protein
MDRKLRNVEGNIFLRVTMAVVKCIICIIFFKTAVANPK